MRFAVVLLSVIVFASLTIGCGNGSGSSNLPSSSPDGDTGGDVGEVSDTGIWIDVADSSGLFDYYISKDGVFGDDCLIPSSVTVSSAVVECTIDILEFDNYANDVKIQYNFPGDSCEYAFAYPSWHWNYSTGYGPSTVSIQNNSAGDTVECKVLENGVYVDCSSAIEVYEQTGGEVTCEYDYTSRETGPNCCLGTYSYILHDDANNDGIVDVGEQTVETKSWGGVPGDCIGGAVATGGWSAVDDDGYPQSIYNYVGSTGVNKVIEIPANGVNLQQGFSYGVNWYETSGTPHSHTGYRTGTSSNLPYAYAPIDDLDGTDMTSSGSARAPVAPYVVWCENRGGEIRHRFDIYLREWNTYVDFITYSTSGGATVNHSVSGSEGTNCEYESIFGGSCNDFYDWEDIVGFGTGGIYDTSIITNTERQKWHPSIEY